jgi:hypothetical protein
MMDGLSSLQSNGQGGAIPATRSSRTRGRSATSSFRAAWTPVHSPDFGDVPEVHHLGAGVPALFRRDGHHAAVIEAPPRHAPIIDLPHITEPLVGAATAVRERLHVTTTADRILQRGLEILPLALALTLISSLVWGAFFLPIPLVIMLLGFDMYWAWRSVNNGLHAYRGYRAIHATARVDWRQRYDAENRLTPPTADRDLIAWDDVKHLVIIPTYKESVEKLRLTIGKLAESEVAQDKLLVVLAMEAGDSEAPQRFQRLREEYGRSFLAFVGTTHPSDIPGEVRGKSSNEAWAAKQAKRLFCDEMGFDLDHLTVTSCDADTLFHPRYFSALTYYFATNPKRYRTFWQGPIFYYNNVWDVPAPLRIQNSLGGINHLAKLMRKYTVLFPQSTYSLSMRMCHDVGYWDVDVVPEDWHMFLKCFFELAGEPEVQPILLPVGNDGVRAHSYTRTYWEHYQQARRHAWGCSDIPYAIRQFVRHPEIPFLKRLRRTWSLTENHVLWSSQWFLITGVAANISAASWGGFLGLHPFAHHNIPDWFITTSRYILMPCMIPLLVMIILDMMMRPPRPKHWKVWLYPVQFVQWLLMAPITLFFTAMPALDAQIRLALGRRLEYKVTEKA